MVKNPIESRLAITSFVAQYRFLSNFYPIEQGMLYEGIIYPSSEHAYQAQKVMAYTTRLEIAACTTAKAAKALAYTFNIRDGWQKIKVPIMRDILRAKFSLQSLKERLLLTGDVALIEGNTWHDNFWGACVCEACASNRKINMLGKLLVQVRTECVIEAL